MCLITDVGAHLSCALLLGKLAKLAVPMIVLVTSCCNLQSIRHICNSRCL